jgi:hypothetical protein
MNITSPISLGELVDKITILEIKKERIQDENKLKNVIVELNALRKVLSKCLSNKEYNNLLKLLEELKQINLKLWVIEDEIRDWERKKEFGSEFIKLARSVYFTNDERANIKKNINILFGSTLVEEKSYNDYK